MDRAPARTLLVDKARASAAPCGSELEKSSLRAMPRSNRSKMFLQHDSRLDDMQIMDAGQRLSKRVGLLLVVAFETKAIAWTDHRFQQRFVVSEGTPSCRLARPLALLK
jgi:hypothetical protein